jgi:hypothetical protein
VTVQRAAVEGERNGNGPARLPVHSVVSSLSRGLSDQSSTVGRAYTAILDNLETRGCRPVDHGNYLTAHCPSHPDQTASLTVYAKAGRAKVRCWSGCSDELDILPALGLRVRDLFDATEGRQRGAPSPATEARIAARRSMSPTSRAADDLLQLPDIGERLCKAIAWHAAAAADPEYWAWRAVQFHQSGRHDVVATCLRHAAFLAYCCGAELVDPYPIESTR